MHHLKNSTKEIQPLFYCELGEFSYIMVVDVCSGWICDMLEIKLFYEDRKLDSRQTNTQVNVQNP